MNDITSAAELAARGVGPGELRQLVRRGELIRLRRGVYAKPGGELTAEQTHRRLVEATIPMLSPDAVLSHGTAAIWHELPVWRPALERIHVTRSRPGGGKHRTTGIVHVAPLTADEILELDGYSVTALPRTVVDLGRTRPFEQAVAAADAALAAGLPLASLEAALIRARGWHGIPKCRAAMEFADPRAESAGESVSRVRCLEHGLPAPIPQFEVRDRRGTLIGRCDLGWPKLKTLGEFDGRIKYGRLVPAHQSIQDVVYREKVREDAFRDLGWSVVRWTWDDLAHFEVVAERLHRAFARAKAV